MPIIPKTPTAKQFAETWTKEFTEAVTKAAGKDGRLTKTEVKKLAARTDADKFFADNALNYLTSTGKESVSVKVLAESAKAYATRAAEVAAGKDGKVSLADGKKLPNDLVEDFFYLRGKTTVAGGGGGLAELQTKVEAAALDLWMPSETDAKFKFISAPGIGNAPITPDLIRQKLGARHDVLLPDVMWISPGEESLAGRTQVEVRDPQEWVNNIVDGADPNDPDSIARAQRIAGLYNTLKADLTDLTLVRFGEISISVFLVGRTKNGELAGVLTGVVET